jgi:hypothetical protein
MANPQLTPEQRQSLFEPLLQSTKAELERLSNGDARVFWALTRKLAKELIYIERGTPQARTALKRRKMIAQNGLCALSGRKLPPSGSELDRFDAFGGYTDQNTRLVHHGCHVADQQRKKYT